MSATGLIYTQFCRGLFRRTNEASNLLHSESIKLMRQLCICYCVIFLGIVTESARKVILANVAK